MTQTSRTPASGANYSYPGTSGVHSWSGVTAGGGQIFADMPAARSLDLVFSGFGFDSVIPANAVIDAIQFQYVGSSDNGATDYRVVLRLANGPDSTNKAKAGAWPLSSSNRIYGDTVSDKWGLAEAYPGMTLAEIIRSPSLSAAIQINNPFGDPEDFQRTSVGGPSIRVTWSLPAVVKVATASGAMAMSGAPHMGTLVDMALADGASLNTAVAAANVVPGVAVGTASLTGHGAGGIAHPAITPGWQSVVMTETGTPTTIIADTGTTEGGI